MKGKTIFIVNPVAGKGKSKDSILIIRAVFESAHIPYEIWETKGPGKAPEMAQKAVLQGAEQVVAVGGDGTVFEVINGLVGSSVPLGILPTGSGNDLCRTLHIPKDIREAAELLLNGKKKWIDLGKMNDRYFVNVASFGFDAEIAAWAKYAKKYFSGTGAYVASVFKNLIGYYPTNVRISFDGQSVETNLLLIAVCNGNYYGGGMRISPNASIIDGYLDVCLIEHMPRWKIGILFPTIFQGKHIKFRGVNQYRAKHIVIEFEGEKMVNLDGDIFLNTSPIHFEVMEQAIQVTTK